MLVRRMLSGVGVISTLVGFLFASSAQALADPISNPRAFVITVVCPQPYGTLTNVTTPAAASGQVLGTTQTLVAFYIEVDGQVFLNRAVNAMGVQDRVVTCTASVSSPNDAVLKFLITP